MWYKGQIQMHLNDFFQEHFFLLLWTWKGSVNYGTLTCNVFTAYGTTNDSVVVDNNDHLNHKDKVSLLVNFYLKTNCTFQQQ